VLSLAVDGDAFTDADLSGDVRVLFPDRKNAAAARLREGQKASGLLTIGNTPGRAIHVQTKREFYFEEGELMVPSTFKPTREELKRKP
jgi:hypothetical protein